MEPGAGELPSVTQLIVQLVQLSAAISLTGRTADARDAEDSAIGSIAYNHMTLTFNDPRLELLFVDYVSCSDGQSCSIASSKAVSCGPQGIKLPWQFLVYLVIFIGVGLVSQSQVELPSSTVRMHPGRAAAGVLFLLLGLIAALSFRSLRHRFALSSSSDLSARPAAEIVVERSTVVRRFKSLVTLCGYLLCLLWVIVFIAIEVSYSLPFLASLVFRFGLLFGVYDLFPLRYFDKTCMVYAAFVVYHAAAWILGWSLGVLDVYFPDIYITDTEDVSPVWLTSITLVTVAVLLVVQSLAYQREATLRQSFVRSVFAAAIQREYHALRQVARTLVSTQLPSVVIGPANLTIMRDAEKSTTLTPAGGSALTLIASDGPRIVIKDSAFQAVCTLVFVTVHAGDDASSEGSFSRMQQLLSAFPVFDSVAAKSNVLKFRTCNNSWIGVAGLADGLAQNEAGEVLPGISAAFRFAIAVLDAKSNVGFENLHFSIGVYTDRTVFAALPGARFEYQLFGSAISDALILASMDREGIFVNETTYQRLAADKIPSGYQLRHRLVVPMTASASQGNVTFKQLTKIAVAQMAKSPSNQELRAATGLSRWSKYREPGSPEIPLARTQPVLQNKDTSTATPDHSTVERPHASIGDVHLNDVQVVEATPSSSAELRMNVHPTRSHRSHQDTTTSVERFLLSRGILQVHTSSSSSLEDTSTASPTTVAGVVFNPMNVDATPAPPSSTSTPPAPTSTGGSIMRQMKRLKVALLGRDMTRSERRFVLRNLSPSPWLLPAFWVGCLVLEIVTESERGRLPFDSPVGLLVFLFTLTCVAWGVIRTMKCYSRFRGRPWDNALIFCAWVSVLSLAHARVYMLEFELAHSCTRVSRTASWLVVAGAGYMISMLPMPLLYCTAAGIFNAVGWGLGRGISNHFLQETYIPVCRVLPTLWSRYYLIVFLTVYFIILRSQQDTLLQNLYALSNKLAAARMHARKQALNMLTLLEEQLTPHALAMGLGPHSISSNAAAVVQVLDRYLGSLSLYPVQAELCKDAVAVQVSVPEAPPAPLFEVLPVACVLSINFVTLRGLDDLLAPEDALAIWASIESELDKAVTFSNGYRINSLGGSYTAVFGLPFTASSNKVRRFAAFISGSTHTDGKTPPLELPLPGRETMFYREAVHCACRCAAAMDQLGTRTGIDLRITVGLDSGQVAAGVLGAHNARYHVVGEAVRTAERLARHNQAHNTFSCTREYFARRAAFANLLSDESLRTLAGKYFAFFQPAEVCGEAVMSVELNEEFRAFVSAQAGITHQYGTAAHSGPPVTNVEAMAIKPLPPKNGASTPKAVRNTVDSSDFKLLGPLGAGHFATVFLAIHRASGNPFAIKVIDAASSKRRSLQAELRALASPLHHPCVVEFVCAVNGSKPGELWLVQEYIAGRSVESLLQGGCQLDETQLRLFLAELVSGVGHLHMLGIVHRDVKPANIIITVTGHVKVIDLGLAALVAVPQASLSPPPAPSSIPVARTPSHNLQPIAASSSVGTSLVSMHSGSKSAMGSGAIESSVLHSSGSHGSESLASASKPLLAPEAQMAKLESLGASGNFNRVVTLLQSLAPGAQGRVNRRLHERTTNNMVASVGTALLLELLPSPGAWSSSTYRALRLYGFWVMKAANAADAITLLQQYGGHVIDVVIVQLSSMRDVDMAIKWRLDPAMTVPLQGLTLCALFPAGFKSLRAATSKLQGAGFTAVDCLPMKAELLDQLAAAGSQHSGLTASPPPSPVPGVESPRITPNVSSASNSFRVQRPPQPGVAAPSTVISPTLVIPPAPAPAAPAPGIVSKRQPSGWQNFGSLQTANARQATVTSIAGTPFAMAPETLDRKTGLISDWFSVGVTAFRCLSGRYPFEGDTRTSVHNKIRENAIAWDALPPGLDPSTVDLLRQLLDPSPETRLGARGDAAEVLAHPFFDIIQPWDLECAVLDKPIFNVQAGRVSLRNTHDMTVVNLATSLVSGEEASPLAAHTQSTHASVSQSSVIYMHPPGAEAPAKARKPRLDATASRSYSVSSEEDSPAA